MYHSTQTQPSGGIAPHGDAARESGGTKGRLQRPLLLFADLPQAVWPVAPAVQTLFEKHAPLIYFPEHIMRAVSDSFVCRDSSSQVDLPTKLQATACLTSLLHTKTPIARQKLPSRRRSGWSFGGLGRCALKHTKSSCRGAITRGGLGRTITRSHSEPWLGCRL